MCKLEKSVFSISIPALRYGSTLLMLGRFLSLVKWCCWVYGSLNGVGGMRGAHSMFHCEIIR